MPSLPLSKCTITLIFKIIELPTENSPPMEVNPLTVTIPKRWADDDDYVVSLESNNGYKSDS